MTDKDRANLLKVLVNCIIAEIRHRDDEMKERKRLMTYFMVVLPITAFMPLAIISLLIALGLISGTVETIISFVSATLSIPINIIGLFKIISNKLFDVKTNIPELLEKLESYFDV